MKISFSIIQSVAMLLPAMSLIAADNADFNTRVKADTQWLTSYGTRQIGTPEHARLQKDLLSKLQEIPGVNVWTHEFPVVVPVNQESYLEIQSDTLPSKNQIYPIWPDVCRLNTTPAGGISGRLIYIGRAEYESIPPRLIRGNIAVMEMSGYASYQRAFDFGASAVIFLESETPEKLLPPSTQSVFKPRYYVKSGPLADALRAGQIKRGKVVSTGKWATITARNIYAGISPSAPTNATPFAVVAAYDSMSRVMGVAPGADIALDCAITLNMLRDMAGKSKRPVLFGFVDAYHINQLGMRQMAAMMSATPKDRTRSEYGKLEEKDLKEYRDAVKELEQFKGVDEGLSGLYDRYACKQLRRLFKDTIGPEMLRLQTIQGEIRLTAYRRESENNSAVRVDMLSAIDDAAVWVFEYIGTELTPDETAAFKAAQSFVAADRQKNVDMDVAVQAGSWEGFKEAREHAAKMLPVCSARLRTRNHILDAVYSKEKDVAPADLALAKNCWARMEARIRGQLAEQEQRCAFFTASDKLRREIAQKLAPALNPDENMLCSFVAGLDISDCGIITAPGVVCGYNRVDLTDREFSQVLKRSTKRGTIWPEASPLRKYVNISAITGREGGVIDENSGMLDQGRRALITSPMKSFLIPGVTWITDDAARSCVDSPLDKSESLNWSRIEQQLPGTMAFFDWLINSGDYAGNQKRLDDQAGKWRHGMGRIVDVSAGETVPRVPRPGFLLTMTGTQKDSDGIRRNEYAWTQEDGSFRIPLMCADVNNYQKNFDIAAFKLNEFGAIKEALSTKASLVTTKLATGFSLGSKPGEQLPRAVVFNCTELNGPSFYDVRFLEPLAQGSLLDSLRGGAPKRFHFKMDDGGQMWGLVEPGIRWQLIIRAGAARVRMALLNSLPDGMEKSLSLRETFQRGFAIDERLSSIPSYIAANDLHVLDSWRLADFRKAGIHSEKIDSIHESAAGAIKKASDAMKSNDGAGLQRESGRALGDEIRAYQAINDMGLDIARGAIFLMLMIVPFCVAMERLLFACARIGRQIVASLAIFAVMTGVLWSFHPAFRISAQPLVIVMAFTILAMSVVVITMILRRFKTAVQEFQSSLAEGSGADMGRGGLLASAVFLGIANMRKRRVRTFLTGATVVLVTFALLCFSSASSYLDKKDFELESLKSKHPSVLIMRPSVGPLQWESIPAIQNLLGDKDAEIGPRSWWCGGQGQTTWQIYLINDKTGVQASVKAALGLPPIEHKLSGIDRILTNWNDFAENGGCYISQGTAEQLGVSAGDTLVMRGRNLVVRGVFDPLVLEDDASLLDGQKILPYDYTRETKDWLDRNSQAAVEQDIAAASSMQAGGKTADSYVPARDVIIVPSELLSKIGGSMRNIGIACATPEKASEVAKKLTQTIVFPAFYSNSKGGVNVVVATPLIAVPPKNLAIPLIVAALIIFTTMLNSVSERKREIYVYTSLGLAPTHVGALFVAEALTYGLMGAVFGYVAGQGTATLLTAAGWMQGVTLNYSGAAVIKTMLMVQGVVVLSAIVPAIVAGKIAAPSTETDWKVPQPVNGVIRDILPFTAHVSTAHGLVAFVHEYLEAHRDGVLGGFDISEIRLFAPGEGGCVSGLESFIWLAPFDMGVRQIIRFKVEQPEDEACSITLEIKHDGGAPKTWWRLNKPFIADLRRQLLGWRKLSPDRIKEYTNRMRK